MKRILTAFIVLLLVTTLTGCGGPGTTEKKLKASFKKGLISIIEFMEDFQSAEGLEKAGFHTGEYLEWGRISVWKVDGDLLRIIISDYENTFFENEKQFYVYKFSTLEWVEGDEEIGANVLLPKLYDLIRPVKKEIANLVSMYDSGEYSVAIIETNKFVWWGFEDNPIYNVKFDGTGISQPCYIESYYSYGIHRYNLLIGTRELPLLGDGISFAIDTK